MDHHVYFGLKLEHQNESDFAAFETALTALCKISGAVDGKWGTPAPVMERPVIDASWTYALTIGFASIADQDSYQVHPEHLRFIESFGSWWDQVQVRDILFK